MVLIAFGNFNLEKVILVANRKRKATKVTTRNVRLARRGKY